MKKKNLNVKKKILDNLFLKNLNFQIGEKDQGCSMITGVSKQYPKANQSVLQKAKYEEKKFDCPTKKS